MTLMRIALWGPLLVAALLVSAYIYFHNPFARDVDELLPVPLSEEDPALGRVGDLAYLGGLDIPRMGQNIGGLSGLRWDAESGRLLAITDEGRWVWITPEETNGKLVSIAKVESGPLLGENGKVLKDKLRGDSESLTGAAGLGWVVGFERTHRILAYKELDQKPERLNLDLAELLGPLGGNSGLEALAISTSTQLLCAQRGPLPDWPNCVVSFDGSPFEGLNAHPPEALREFGAVPSDADMLSDGSAVILFRSYSPTAGNTAAIVSFAPDGTRRDLATLQPPLTLDNFEGLAVREEGEGEEARTFLYIVSDDNFSGSQRTLLMKFELEARGQG